MTFFLLNSLKSIILISSKRKKGFGQSFLLQKNLELHMLFYIFKMPFYAVAIGKTPGVYKTWAECNHQTNGYPQAKFRKFNTEADAFSFVKTNGSAFKELSFEPNASTPLTVENLKPPELKALGKYPSQTLLKQDKLSVIAEKLDDFIERTNQKLSEFSQRLDDIEASILSGNSSSGKRKNENKNETQGKRMSKKTKASENGEDSQSDETSDNASEVSTRSKSQSVEETLKEEKEEVDSPWGRNFNVPPQGFIVDNEGYVIVYTDGACTNNGRLGAKAGIGVWFGHDNPYNVAAPAEGNATNNNAEIQAATRAIEQANLVGIQNLNIHTDSQFMINCMTQWINKWKKNNWLTTNGGPVKNKEQLVILDRAIQSIGSVKWTHVRGHMGEVGNECADTLARTGASMY